MKEREKHGEVGPLIVIIAIESFCSSYIIYIERDFSWTAYLGIPRPFRSLNFRPGRTFNLELESTSSTRRAARDPSESLISFPWGERGVRLSVFTLRWSAGDATSRRNQSEAASRSRDFREWRNECQVILSPRWILLGRFLAGEIKIVTFFNKINRNNLIEIRITRLKSPWLENLFFFLITFFF